MNRILILAHQIDKYLANGDRCITELYAAGTDSKLMRSLRKASLATGFGVNIFLNDWYNNCDKYDCIILFDTGNADYLINLIHNNVPNTRLILWYWNPVEKTIPIGKINRQYCEIWSYHEADCKRYGLKYNTQFFIADDENIIRHNGAAYSVSGCCGKKEYMSDKTLSTEEETQDVYFVGADKNRSKILCEMKDVFDSMGITYKFILTACKGYNEAGIPYSEPVRERQNQKNILASKALIEVIDGFQATGQTLRPFEAAYRKKKFITNNLNVKELKFYNMNNIFIWGIDAEEGIKQFIDSPYDDSLQQEIEYYSFKNWLERFWALH